MDDSAYEDLEELAKRSERLASGLTEFLAYANQLGVQLPQAILYAHQPLLRVGERIRLAKAALANGVPAEQARAIPATVAPTCKNE